MKIVLISSTEADRDLFRTTHHAAYRPLIEAMFGWDDAVQDGYADKDFDANRPNKIICDGTFAGFASCKKKPDHIWLASIFLLPVFQNQGIGSRLIHSFLTDAQATNLPLRLQTLRLNRAKILYERLGFRGTGSNDTYWYMEHPVTAGEQKEERS